MRPSDALAYRRIMLDHCREVVTERQRSADDDYDGFYESAREIIEITSDCDTYYVSSDMTAVAVAAARTMPSQVLRRDDLPSESGFLVFDHKVADWVESENTYPIQGFMWRLRAHNSPLFGDIECYCVEPPPCDHCLDKAPPPCLCRETCECAVVGYGDEIVIYPLTEVRPGLMMPVTSLEDGGEMQWVTGGPPLNDSIDLGPVLLATWTLMQQSLTVSQTVPADRAERRRCGRANLPPDIVIVRLRRKSLDSENAEQGEEEGRPWSHRWLVSGHWRNQWLPSRTCHRLQWIYGHVKGPQNKPLVVKDRVTAWVR